VYEVPFAIEGTPEPVIVPEKVRRMGVAETGAASAETISASKPTELVLMRTEIECDI